MPIWLNYDLKKAVITRFKCGSSSVGDTLIQYPEWSEYAVDTLIDFAIDDDYRMLKDKLVDIKGWETYFVARDPITYTISGYKHFWDLHRTNYFCRNAFAKVTPEYTFHSHVRIIGDAFLNYDLTRWRDAHIFLTHCVSQPILHWRPWMHLIKLEDDFKELHLHLGLDNPFPKNNQTVDFDGDIEIGPETERLLKIRWSHSAAQWGYDIDESIERTRQKYK